MRKKCISVEMRKMYISRDEEKDILDLIQICNLV